MSTQLVITDIDGVWTDGGMYYASSGDEIKKFNTSDSAGVLLLRSLGIPLAIITGEDTPIVTNRAKKLRIEHVILGSKDKLTDAKALCEKLSLSLDQVAFVGNDIGDIGLLEGAAVSAVPSDAPSYVAESANHVLAARGGEGAFREFVERIVLSPSELQRALEMALR